MLGTGITERLEENPLRKELVHHPFFKEVRSSEALDREKVGVFLGQWWHPLHYFPHFLSRTIDQVPMLEMKTAISKILYQELGEGDPARAHERIYVTTMRDAGFDEATVARAAPFAETARLVQRYREASGERLSALGFVYGTEVADLAMVPASATPSAASAASRTSPGWTSTSCRSPTTSPRSTRRSSPTSPPRRWTRSSPTPRRWSLWIDFFNRLRKVMFGTEE